MPALIRSMSSCDGCVGFGRPVRPNIIKTGTGPFAFAGTTTVIRMFTSICGYAELSTWPIRFFAITGANPTNSWSVTVTVQSTLGRFFGSLP